MRTVLATVLTSAGLLVASVVAAQTSPPASGVLATGIPPNAIDRVTAVTDQRRANAAQASAVDRLAAERATRAANSRSGPVAGSTMTDGVSGLGANSGIGSSAAGTEPPH